MSKEEIVVWDRSKLTLLDVIKACENLGKRLDRLEKDISNLHHKYDLYEKVYNERLDRLEKELETQKTVIQAIQNLLEPIKKKRD